MPLTRLANSIIDGVAARREEVAADVLKYLGSDLLFYRADGPDALMAKQGAAWDPIVRWAADELGARFVLAEGIVHVRQPDHAIAAAEKAIPADRWIVGALHAVTTLTGSALLALALMRGFRRGGRGLACGACGRGLEFRDLGFRRSRHVAPRRARSRVQRRGAGAQGDEGLKSVVACMSIAICGSLLAAYRRLHLIDHLYPHPRSRAVA